MRLIIVSNRLPVTVEKKKNEYLIKESVGGLVTGISAYLQMLKSSHVKKTQYLWVGWAGQQNVENNTVKDILKRKKLYPVNIPDSLMDKFYLGFCNRTIWPLFHYFTAYTSFDANYWKHYVTINHAFKEQLLQIIRPDDTIWIHDYHLMLLPEMIRKEMPDIKIGFFLHIPFPSYEVFRMLPDEWRTGILRGLLGSDLIGFHTYEYTKYFLGCVLRILGHENTAGEIHLPDRVIKAGSFPMGIEFNRYSMSAKNPKARATASTLLKRFAGKKIILSIDRLDYTKGILNRLYGYRQFLEKNPEWRGRVALLLIVVPSRIGVDRYSQMKREIDELAGNINGNYGTLDWMPVVYQYKFFPFEPLTGTYLASDAALITPLRDGMNLIAKEYLACRRDNKGVLIISEMAGAAKELGEALIINPNDTAEIARAIKMALEIPEKIVVKSNRIMRERLKRYNVVKWAESFINSLESVKHTQSRLGHRILNRDAVLRMHSSYRKSHRRLILLDYDGTLVPHQLYPEHAIPDDEVHDIINSLCSDRRNHTVVISGRDRSFLQKWFGRHKVNLVAEHGVFYKKAGGKWEKSPYAENKWKKKITSILKNYTDLVPGSFIEEKEYSLVWHFRKADPEQCKPFIGEIIDVLQTYVSNQLLHVTKGNKIIEIKNTGIDKGAFATKMLNGNRYDFIFAAGDDLTDEDMFKVLPPEAFSVKIGMKSSFARYNLPASADAIKLLKSLIYDETV